MTTPEEFKQFLEGMKDPTEPFKMTKRELIVFLAIQLENVIQPEVIKISPYMADYCMETLADEIISNTNMFCDAKLKENI
jgi:hypothetical protein